jgi:hypothetical protein
VLYESDWPGEKSHDENMGLGSVIRATSSLSEPVGVISARVGGLRGWARVGKLRFLISGDCRSDKAAIWRFCQALVQLGVINVSNIYRSMLNEAFRWSLNFTLIFPPSFPADGRVLWIHPGKQLRHLKYQP